MKQRKKSFGMRISAFVLSFAMVCTLLAGVNVVAFAADSDEELTDSVSVLRAYNPNNSEHLYTIDEDEYNANVSRGYQGEGEAWKAPIYSETEVWRAYNPNSGEHMLASEAEVYALEAAGWQNEGFKMYSDDLMGTPIYRVFNPNSNDAGSHHYCGYEEAAGLVDLGWEWDNDGEPVIYGVEEEQPVVLVSITDVDQLSANSIYVEFDQPATGLVDKDDIEIAAVDGTATLPINSMTMSADGLSAEIVTAINLVDGKDYTVSLNLSESTFTASVGEVDSIIVTTASATQNVETPIEFVIYDEMGVDITSTIDVDATCSIEVVGDDVLANTNQASEATVTMGTVGETCDVIVTYNSGEADALDVVGEGEITCIEPEAVVGLPIYNTVSDADADSFVNAKSEMNKFYWGQIQSDPVTIEVDEESDTVYFCAVDISDYSVYSYDEYEITSSDEDVMSIATSDAEGKNVKFTVSGNQEGTANVVIKATVNGKDTAYTVPVRVTDKGVLSTITYTVDKTKMTDAIDMQYYGKSTVKAYDNNGRELVEGLDYDVTFALNDEEKAGAIDEDTDDLVPTVNPYYMSQGFKVNSVKTIVDGQPVAIPGTYTAYAATAGKKTIKATVSQDDIVKEKAANVTVEKLDKNIWNHEDNEKLASVTYKVELGKSSLSAMDASGDDDTPYATTARLAAYVNSKFAGYVYTGENGVIVIGTSTAALVGGEATGVSTGSSIRVTDASGIDDGTLKLGVKYGTSYAVLDDLDGVLPMEYVMLNGSLNFVEAPQLVGDNFMATAPVTMMSPTFLKAGGMYVSGDSKYDATFAKPGAYTVEFRFDQNKGAKTDQKVTSKLTVTDVVSVTVPSVTVKSRNVSSMTPEDIIENMTTLVDMNNNTSEHESIVGLYSAPLVPIEDFTGDSLFVKYVAVEDNVEGQTLIYYVPINKTFYVK